MSTYIPRIYRQPQGGPLRWQDDVTGVLPSAVKAFLDEGLGNATATSEQIELVRDYCQYYIEAPCWATNTMEAQFADLRARVKSLTSGAAIAAWIADSLKVGIDPL